MLGQVVASRGGWRPEQPPPPPPQPPDDAPASHVQKSHLPGFACIEKEYAGRWPSMHPTPDTISIVTAGLTIVVSLATEVPSAGERLRKRGRLYFS